MQAIDDPAGGEIVDFDEARLDACSTHELAELMTEAAMLAEAFAPDCRPGEREAQIQTLARSLQSGDRQLDHDRPRARLVAAALRRLARVTTR
jgi:hypothetical protein